MAEGSAAQIRQMVNFILQEAHEKANEIRIKTEHDFNLEKQMLVHNATVKINEEYSQKEKNKEIEERINRSAEVSTARVKKLKARDELLVKLRQDAIGKISTLADSPQYPAIMTKLITQALLRIEETKVEIRARQKDINIVQNVYQNAVQAAQGLLKPKGITYKPEVTVATDSVKLLPPNSAGGVVLTALGGKIMVDNTLDSRLRLSYEELAPEVRSLLFG